MDPWLTYLDAKLATADMEVKRCAEALGRLMGFDDEIVPERVTAEASWAHRMALSRVAELQAKRALVAAVPDERRGISLGD